MTRDTPSVGFISRGKVAGEWNWPLASIQVQRFVSMVLGNHMDNFTIAAARYERVVVIFFTFFGLHSRPRPKLGVSSEAST